MAPIKIEPLIKTRRFNGELNVSFQLSFNDRSVVCGIFSYYNKAAKLLFDNNINIILNYRLIQSNNNSLIGNS